VPAGAPVDLPCRLPAAADLTWSREGGAPLPAASSKPSRTVLRLERVGEQDSGRYICTSQGRTQYITLTVERKLFLILTTLLANSFQRIFVNLRKAMTLSSSVPTVNIVPNKCRNRNMALAFILKCAMK
jgi:hypothetical protein